MKSPYKIFVLTLTLFSLIFTVTAQNSDGLWSKTTALEKSTTKKIDRRTIPNTYEVFHLNLKLLKSKLDNAPKRIGKSNKSNTIISFPNEKGALEKYQIFEASIMEENLQKKHPNNRSYIGKNIKNPSSTIRFSVNSLGLHAMILQREGGAIYIDPYTSDKKSYIIYSKKSLPVITPFVCGVEEFTTATKLDSEAENARAENANDGMLRTFRLAVATTGEYSQFHLTRQGVNVSETDAVKKAAVLDAIVVTMTRVNGIFEKDVALTMVLVANNTDIIFLDPVTDSFTNNDASTLINESQTVINASIGSLNYDIGHTFSTGGGGLAQLRSPCGTGKARGITGLSNPIGDSYDVDFVSHEMGHQYGANHTFNGGAGNCGSNRNNGTAVEPGSGSTIMAYSGICAPQNVQSLADSYFHLVSIREMWTNITIGNSTCAAQSSTSNTAPTIENIPNYTIPISTPFILNAVATDVNGDELTYTWEQLDTEIVTAPPVSTATGGPAFRSLSPTTSSMRYFPKQSTVIGGNLSTTWEVLPSVSRTMLFAATVRDNNIAGGQTVSKETTITFDASAGPFKLTSQATATTWDSGTSQTVIWDVANTNTAPVNCLFVNILLSLDSGVTYPITLATNVANDGSHGIIVPTNSTTRGRVKVESVGNIFYAMNAASITIQDSEFIMNFTTLQENTCAPDNVVYNFTYNTFLGFNEETTFSATGNPAGTAVAFNPTSATTDATTVEVTVSGILNDDVGEYIISVTGTSASVTKTTDVTLNVFSSVINAPILSLPENNAPSVLKPYLLSWESDINALSYDVQIATDNTFTTIVESENVSTNSFSPQLLQVNTNYFWRVKARNECGESSFSGGFNFTTANEVCSTNSATDTPLDIPDNNATGISSVIRITQNKTITDINVTVNITHPWIGDLTLSLIGPQGTTIALATQLGAEGDNYTNTVFDDAATSAINTAVAPFTGTFRPQGNLSDFNTKESLGDWTLKVVDGGPDDSNNFTIEAIGETCPNKNNGQIIIEALANLNYTTTINGTVYNFTGNDGLSVSNLIPGSYEFCIGVVGDTYTQCFVVEIIEGVAVSGKTSVSSNKASVEIETGTAPFTIFINGIEQFKTSAPVFTMDVKHGDIVEVKTAVSCEGTYAKTIELLDTIVAYPNPTNGTFEIALPVAQKEVLIEVYNIYAQLVSVKTYPILYGKVQLDIASQPTGLYIAKIHLDKPVVLKILKQ